jgi:hypothetical protein
MMQVNLCTMCRLQGARLSYKGQLLYDSDPEEEKKGQLLYVSAPEEEKGEKVVETIEPARTEAEPLQHNAASRSFQHSGPFWPRPL